MLKSQKGDDMTYLWSTIGGESKEGEEAEATFQQIVNKILNINLKIKHIFPIYDYFDETLDKVNYVFYAEVSSPREFSSFQENTFSWVAFHETLKLLFSARTKQDVMVGERVINLKWREDQADKSRD